MTEQATQESPFKALEVEGVRFKVATLGQDGYIYWENLDSKKLKDLAVVSEIFGWQTVHFPVLAKICGEWNPRHWPEHSYHTDWGKRTLEEAYSIALTYEENRIVKARTKPGKPVSMKTPEEIKQSFDWDKIQRFIEACNQEYEAYLTYSPS